MSPYIVTVAEGKNSTNQNRQADFTKIIINVTVEGDSDRRRNADYVNQLNNARESELVQ